MAKAQVDSVDVLKQLKIGLVKFMETASVALAEAESDLNRTRQWLDLEQQLYWNTAGRKAAEALARAEEALRMKRLFKDATGHRQSTVDEEKAVKVCRARLEHCQQKALAVKKWKIRMDREAQVYKGSVSRFSTTLAADLPAAAARLENFIRQLEAYVGYAPEAVSSTSDDVAASTAPADDSVGGSMKRTIEEEKASQENPAEQPKPPSE